MKEAPPEELRVVRTAEFERRAAKSAATGAGSIDAIVAILAIAATLAGLSWRRPVRDRR